MTGGELSLHPLLARHPDARRAKAPLLQPVLLPYLALIFGSGVASLAACYNAAMMRRGGLAAKSLLIGILGTIAFVVVGATAIRLGAEPAVAMILGRVIHFAFGGLLFARQRPYVRGNEFLSGPMAPLLPSYLVTIAISIFLPARISLLLLGVPLAG